MFPDQDTDSSDQKEPSTPKEEHDASIYLGANPPHKPDRPTVRVTKEGPTTHDEANTFSVANGGFHGSQSNNPSEVIQFLLNTVTDKYHRSHQIFCEMDILQEYKSELEWKESARWVKYEEDVEDGGERWSKPHVASLSMHALFALKNSILDGAVLLDISVSTKAEVVDHILECWKSKGLVDNRVRDEVRAVLLKQHKHLHTKRRYTSKYEEGKRKMRSVRTFTDVHNARNDSSTSPIRSVRSLHELPGTKSSESLNQSRSLSNLRTESVSSFDSGVLNESGDMSSPSHASKPNLHFMRKIPKDTEVANLMIGELESLQRTYVAFVRLDEAAVIGDMSEVSLPTKFLFVLLGPKGLTKQHTEIGRSMATMMIDEIFREVAYKCRHKEELAAGIDEFLTQGTMLPPGGWDPKIRIEPPLKVPSQELRRNSSQLSLGLPDSLEAEEEESHLDPTLVRTGKIFGGLIVDLKRKLRWYASDFRDCFHIQCLASFIFLFLATFTQNVTFGGMMGIATDGYIGTMECILAAALTGVVFALFSGQPLSILGSTGPMLILETIIYGFCKDYQWDFMPFRFWIGMWTTLILLVVVAFDLSSLVKYITRFTEESFATLISIIFIVEAFDKLAKIGTKDAPMNLHPETPVPTNCSCRGPNMTSMHAYQNTTSWSSLNKTTCMDLNGTLIGDGCNPPHYKDNVFLLSILLFLGTFAIAIGLKMLRNGPCFPTFVRQTISDFSVLIAIVVMAGIDSAIGLDTPKLTVPAEFQPTNKDLRGWVVNPISDRNPWWLYLLAAVPALLSSILVFLDQQITAVIVNRKENKLRKGSGYHLDLLIVAILIAICSLLGLPWYVAATVSALVHIMSLKKESECNAPGERPTFLGVREQRVTALLVGILSGLSVLITEILRIIPMAVLYGVFLYMGIVALSGMQLVTRLMIILMPPKYQPDETFLRHVQQTRVHLFTFIQIICLVILVVVKSIKIVSIAFPLMVLATCVVRKMLDHLFTQRELKWLDDIMPGSKTDKQRQEEREKNQKGKERNILPEKFVQNNFNGLEKTGSEEFRPAFYLNGDQQDYSHHKGSNSTYTVNTKL